MTAKDKRKQLTRFREVIQLDSKDKYVNSVSESERKAGQDWTRVFVYLKMCSKERVTEKQAV